MSNDATFDRHITVIASKGQKPAGWALRVFRSREETLMLTLLKSLIRHSLEYCSPLWFPTDQANISTIEKVQRSFTRRVSGLQGLNYWERLQKLNLYSLERRRERYIILYIWKSWHNLVPDLGLSVQSFDKVYGLFFALPRLPTVPGSSHVSKLLQRSIFYQGVRLFNSLPRHLRMGAKETEEKTNDTHCSPDTVENSAEDEPSLSKYKEDLDKYLQRIPDQPTVPGLPRSADSNSIIDQRLYIRPPKQKAQGSSRRKRKGCNSATTSGTTRRSVSGNHDGIANRHSSFISLFLHSHFFIYFSLF